MGSKYVLKPIDYDVVKPLQAQAEKEMLCFGTKTKYFGLYEQDKLVAITGLVYYANKVVNKNNYVLPEHRNQGIYRYLMDWMMQETKGWLIECVCTPSSRQHMINRNFQIIQEYKNGCVKLRYENI
jgi:GNAT superfamily N-acetyltransferase